MMLKKHDRQTVGFYRGDLPVPLYEELYEWHLYTSGLIYISSDDSVTFALFYLDIIPAPA